MDELNDLLMRYRQVNAADKAVDILKSILQSASELQLQHEFAISVCDILVANAPNGWPSSPSFIAALLRIITEYYFLYELNAAVLPCIKLSRIFICYGLSAHPDQLPHANALESVFFAEHLRRHESSQSQKADVARAKKAVFAKLKVRCSSMYYSELRRLFGNNIAQNDTNEGDDLAIIERCRTVRVNALICLNTVINFTPQRLLFPHWGEIVSHDACLKQKDTLIAVVLRDSSGFCRFLAANGLNSLLDSSAGYIAVAEHSENPTSFMSYSQVVARRLTEMHRCMIFGLSSEKIYQNLRLNIKVLGSLMYMTPYHRLKPGLLSRSIKSIRSFTGHKDPLIVSATLTSLGHGLCANCSAFELQQIVKYGSTSATGCSSSSEVSNAPTPDASRSSKAWIFDTCVSLADSNSAELNRSVKIDAIQCLCLLIRHLSELIIRNDDNLTILLDLVGRGLRSSEPYLYQHYLKLFEMINRAARGRLVDFDEMGIDQVDEVATMDESVLTTLSNFWNDILPSLMIHFMQSGGQDSSVAFDCISAMGSSIFDMLLINIQLLCKTIALATASSLTSPTQPAALKSLGFLIQFDSLRRDEGFIADVHQALLTMTNAARNRSSCTQDTWTLSILCDLARESDYLLSRYVELVEMSVWHAKHSASRARSNAVRSIGVLLSYEDAAFDQLTTERQNELLEILHSNAVHNTPKVRWITFDAIGSLIRHNKKLCRLFHARGLFRQTVTVLISGIGFQRNKKSRYAAVMAFQQFLTREFISDQLVASMKAASTSYGEAMCEVDDLKYKKELCDSLRSLFFNLIKMLLPLDLADFDEQLTSADIIVLFESKQCLLESPVLQRLQHKSSVVRDVISYANAPETTFKPNYD